MDSPIFIRKMDDAKWNELVVGENLLAGKSTAEVASKKTLFL